MPEEDDISEEFHRDDSRRKEDSQFQRMQEEISAVPTGQRHEVMLQQLQRGYECAICFNTIKRTVAVWSCRSCYCILHIYCIKQWAKGGGFDCPNCRQHQGAPPKEYRCFCGQVKDPEDTTLLAPHSCGQQCGRTHGKHCNHPCGILCHPGPCPQCERPREISCRCGRAQNTISCSDPKETFSCETECGKVLGCGRHVCKMICHAGECSPCKESFEQACFCGESIDFHSCTMAKPFPVYGMPRLTEGGEPLEEVELDDMDEDEPPATFSCGGICNRPLDCQEHICLRVCHQGECGKCPRDPEKAKRCPCGKKPLDSLTDTPRTLCTDPIATCTGTCNKRRECGAHLCTDKCHDGECTKCKENVAVTCRCGENNRHYPCHVLGALRRMYEQDLLMRQFSGESQEQIREKSVTIEYNGKVHHYPYVCTRKCNSMMSCKKHRCNVTCCVARKDGEAFMMHQCMKTCSRKLACKAHTCEELCHDGPCPPCGHLITEPLSCACGRTVSQPPLPCNARPPRCNHPCQKERPCGHEPSGLPHNCHQGDCPPCVVLTSQACWCKRSFVDNVPCHKISRSCGEICNKQLRCGHHCSKKCHSGDCEESACTKPCGKPLACQHPCSSKCHPGKGCPGMCTHKVTLTCDCATRKEALACRQYQQLLKQKTTASGAIALKDMPKLECNSDCVGEFRLKGLADALGVSDKRQNTPTCNWPMMLVGDAQSRLREVQQTEKIFSDFLNGNKTFYMFPPMTAEKRQFLHHLAAYYRFTSESQDREPKRTVCLHKLPSSRIPSPLLSEAATTQSYDSDLIADDRVKNHPHACLLFENLPGKAGEDSLLEYLSKFAGSILLKWTGSSKCVATFSTTQMREDANSHLCRMGFPYTIKPYVKSVYPNLQGPTPKPKASAAPSWGDRVKSAKPQSSAASEASKKQAAWGEGPGWAVLSKKKPKETGKSSNSFALLDKE